VIGL
jgi:hypothetical protein